MKNVEPLLIDDRLPPLCRLLSSPGSESLVIVYGAASLGLKLGRALVGFFIGVLASAPFLAIGFIGRNALFEPGWTKKLLVAAALLVGTYAALRVTKNFLVELFGSTLFTASPNSLRIKKRFLFFSSGKDIEKRDITGFELRRQRTGKHTSYRLWIKGSIEQALTPDEVSEESAIWLGECLANWFEVSLDLNQR